MGNNSSRPPPVRPLTDELIDGDINAMAARLSGVNPRPYDLDYLRQAFTLDQQPLEDPVAWARNINQSRGRLLPEDFNERLREFSGRLRIRGQPLNHRQVQLLFERLEYWYRQDMLQRFQQQSSIYM